MERGNNFLEQKKKYFVNVEFKIIIKNPIKYETKIQQCCESQHQILGFLNIKMILSGSTEEKKDNQKEILLVC